MKKYYIIAMDDVWSDKTVYYTLSDGNLYEGLFDTRKANAMRLSTKAGVMEKIKTILDNYKNNDVKYVLSIETIYTK